MTNIPPTVLVIEGNEPLAQVYALHLVDEYNVLVTADGNEALDILQSDVDVVLLDKRLPGLAGEDVMGYIDENDLDCSVALITAVDPSIEDLGLNFQAYLKKPFGKKELRTVVDRLVRQKEFGPVFVEFFSLQEQLSILEDELNHSDSRPDAQYSRLHERKREAQEQIRQILERTEDTEFQRAFEEFSKTRIA